TDVARLTAVVRRLTHPWRGGLRACLPLGLAVAFEDIVVGPRPRFDNGSAPAVAIAAGQVPQALVVLAVVAVPPAPILPVPASPIPVPSVPSVPSPPVAVDVLPVEGGMVVAD